MLFFSAYLFSLSMFFFIPNIFCFYINLIISTILFLVICLNFLHQTSDFLLIYFCVSAVTSFFFLFGTFFLSNKLVLLSLVIKGMFPPFHILFSKFIFLLDKISFFLLSTAQKLPIFFLFQKLFNFSWSSMFFFFSSMLSIMMIYSSTNLFSQLFFSSMSNSFFFISSIFFSFYFFLIFFLTYSLYTALLIFSFDTINMNFSLSSSMIFFCYMGLPPFPFFWLKWNLFYEISLFSPLFSLMFLLLFFSHFLYFFWIMILFLNLNDWSLKKKFFLKMIFLSTSVILFTEIF